MPVKSGTVYDISVCLSRVAFALSLDTPLTSQPGIKQTLLNVEPPTSFINDNVSVSPFSIPAKKNKKERSLPSRNTGFDRACVTRNLLFRLSRLPPHTHTQTARVSTLTIHRDHFSISPSRNNYTRMDNNTNKRKKESLAPMERQVRASGGRATLSSLLIQCTRVDAMGL